jgi:hypothetical protein
MSPNNPTNGLVFRTESVGDGDDEILIWEFIVNDSAPVNEVLEWNLQPVNPLDPVCGLVPYAQCINRWGVPLSPLVAQFPDRDVDDDDDNDFGAHGVVFRYTELRLANGNRFTQPLLFGPCHNGEFNILSPILCEVTVGTENVPTTGGGNVATAGVVAAVIKGDDYNVKNKSGTHDIRILGELNLNQPPVETLEINGIPISFSRSRSADVNGDGFIDFIAKVPRKETSTILAATCSGNGPTEVKISGTLNPEGRFTGTDTINIVNCPN